MTVRRIAGLALAAVVAGVVATAAPLPLPALPVAPAAADHCSQHQGGDDSGTSIQVECPETGDNGTGDDGGNGNDRGNNSGGGGIDPAEACAGYPGWEDCETVVAINGIHPDSICGYVVAPDQSQLEYYHPDAPEGAVLYYNICPREGLYYSEDTQWQEGGPVVVPPSPEEVAEALLAQVRARLLEPELRTYPAADRPAVIGVPTFVEVTNWQGTIHEEGCDTGVCVELTAAPALTFDPGESGAEVVTCEPGGTAFNPSGAEPDEQAAADGACTHAYRLRTLSCPLPGSTTPRPVPGRPERWPGEVNVTWTVTWEGAGEAGEFDPIVLSTGLPRAVTEMCTVVTDMGPGGRA